MSNPMEQFVVKPIIPIKVGDIDISFTNSSLFMVLAVILSTLIFAFCLAPAQHYTQRFTVNSRKHIRFYRQSD